MDCTIITVLYSPESHKYHQLSRELIEHQNPNIRFRWLVHDNKATPLVHPEQYPKWARGSYHHGQALNVLWGQASTRFAIVLDPDFFVVMPAGIEKALSFMQEHNIAFWGAPWHPRWYKKYQDFPSVHCMIIDRNISCSKQVDFLPDYTTDTNSGNRLLSFFYWFYKYLGGKAALYGQSRDTGYKVYLRFKNTLSFILDPESIGTSEGPFGGALLKEVRKNRWEAFTWNAEAFGFHIRSQGDASLRNSSEELSAVKKLLLRLTSFYGISMSI